MPSRKTATPAASAAVDAPRASAIAPHASPVLALAIVHRSLFSAGHDGRVLRYPLADRLIPDAVVRDDPDDPVTALARLGDHLVAASGRALVVLAADASVVATATLGAPPTAMAVRGEAIFLLASGAIHRYQLGPKGLRGTAVVPHAGGVATQLDVDDAGGQALVVLDATRVELIDLVKKKRVAEWSRKGRALSPRFSTTDGSLLVVTDDDYGLVRLKAATGRSTGEVMGLASSVNGPVELDASRGAAAVRSTGEDVEVVDVAGARTRFFLQVDVTPAGDKLLASLAKIPRFAQLAPGFFVRRRSAPAPLPPRTATSLALDDGGRHVASGFVSGEVVAADTTTAWVASSHAGTLCAPRCRALRFFAYDAALGDAASDRDVWVVARDGRVLVADLDALDLRDAGAVELPAADGPLRGSFYLDEAWLTFVSRAHVARWPRGDLSRREVLALPEHKGALLRGGELVLLPKDSMGHDGFDLATLDLATGRLRTRARFVRDVDRFPLGSDPHGWAALGAAGDQPTVTLWAGSGMTIAKTIALDVDTGALGAVVAAGVCSRGGVVVRVANAERRVIASRVATGEVVAAAPLLGDEASPGPAVYAEASRTLAAALDSRIAVWHPDGTRITVFGHREVHSVWLGANGRGMLSRDREALRVWDVAP